MLSLSTFREMRVQKLFYERPIADSLIVGYDPIKWHAGGVQVAGALVGMILGATNLDESISGGADHHVHKTLLHVRIVRTSVDEQE
jgi:hypothetical protein